VAVSSIGIPVAAGLECANAEGWTRKRNGTRINALIKDARRNPFQGLGKPEPLKPELAGWWSRRITSEHRLVYRIEGIDQQIEIAMCRNHYT
jgi:toxin YoeB